jgi:glycosyltransferase involved in cell wall biosynthesis
MNTEYVLLGGFLWRLWHKKIALWYVHGLVDSKLRLAEKITNIIFSVVKESFRLKSKKLKIVGHGIDYNIFKNINTSYVINKKFRIISIGRISPIKDYETLIMAVAKFRESTENFRVEIIGGLGLEKQKKYLEDLQKLVKSLQLDNFIFFMGAVPNTDIVKYLEAADLFVNMSRTGGLDKAVLEALAAGVPVVTCNEPAIKAIAKYLDVGHIAFPTGDYLDLCDKIIFWENINLNERQSILLGMRDVVRKDHSLDTLVDKIKNFYTI